MTALNIGCGPVAVYPNWINIDNSPAITLSKVPVFRRFVMRWPKEVKRVDILRGLPFTDSSIDYIYSSHTFEHLQTQKSVRLLKECRRVLKSGGVIRIAVPDLGKLVQDYLNDPSPEASHRFIDRLLIRHTWRDILHPGAHHQQMFDQKSLCAAFEKAGFAPLVCEFADSRIPDIREIELQGRASESLYVEAVKA